MFCVFSSGVVLTSFHCWLIFFGYLNALSPFVSSVPIGCVLLWVSSVLFWVASVLFSGIHLFLSWFNLFLSWLHLFCSCFFIFSISSVLWYLMILVVLNCSAILFFFVCLVNGFKELFPHLSSITGIRHEAS